MGKARARKSSPVVVNLARLCHNAASRRPAIQGCRGGETAQSRAPLRLEFPDRGHMNRPTALMPCVPIEESQMPKGYKLKTKSGAKKRFKITASGKVKYQQTGKRHGMIKRTTKQIREHRGTAVLFKTDGDNIKKYFLPNG
jgi:large subunit ribosomal protein L35